MEIFFFFKVESKEGKLEPAGKNRLYLSIMARVDLSEKVCFVQELRRAEEPSYVFFWGKSFSGRGDSSAKALM